jgi:hypothetical protein
VPTTSNSSADYVRKVALALPETTEQLTWEVHPTFRVRGKIFVILGEDGTTASIKASKEEQQALIGAQPLAYAVAPHVGRYGWVLVTLRHSDADELTELVTEAWRLTAPKRLVAAADREQA